jgi:hypothetical protein
MPGDVIGGARAGEVQLLPGMEEELRRLALAEADESEISLCKSYTGEGLLARDPAKYELAARLYFEFGIGVTRVARLLHISPNTVYAIADRELVRNPGRVEEMRRNATVALQHTVAMGIEAARGLFCDKDAVRAAGLPGVAKALSLLTSLAQGDTGREGRKVQPQSDVGSDYLDVIDGGPENRFVPGKNRGGGFLAGEAVEAVAGTPDEAVDAGSGEAANGGVVHA